MRIVLLALVASLAVFAYDAQALVVSTGPYSYAITGGEVLFVTYSNTEISFQVEKIVSSAETVRHLVRLTIEPEFPSSLLGQLFMQNIRTGRKADFYITCSQPYTAPMYGPSVKSYEYQGCVLKKMGL